jgi:hypothetical protein
MCIPSEQAEHPQKREYYLLLQAPWSSYQEGWLEIVLSQMKLQ